MSSILATDTAAGRTTRGATRPVPTTDDSKRVSQRYVGQSGSAAIGRADRPVLRIVADQERRPVVTRFAPRALVEPDQARWSSGVETPLRRVPLEQFFAVDGESQELRMTPLPAVRLTRRGRASVLGVALTAVLGLGVMWASGSAATDHPERTRVVVVGTGDTLWDLSVRVAGGGDIRATMSHIEQLNHLDSAAVQAGQRLRIPVG